MGHFVGFYRLLSIVPESTNGPRMLGEKAPRSNPAGDVLIGIPLLQTCGTQEPECGLVVTGILRRRESAGRRHIEQRLFRGRAKVTSVSIAG